MLRMQALPAPQARGLRVQPRNSRLAAPVCESLSYGFLLLLYLLSDSHHAHLQAFPGYEYNVGTTTSEISNPTFCLAPSE